MQNAKLKTALRILVSAAIFALVSGIIVAIIGLWNGWKTSTQYSDGLFWAGAILISCGLVTVLGRYSQGSIYARQSRQEADRFDMAERSRQLAADLSRGHNILAFLGTSGLLLFVLSGLAILVGNLF